MKTLHRRTLHVFKQLYPWKRWSDYSSIDLTFDEVHSGYLNQDNLLKIDGLYYYYIGESFQDCIKPKPSVIRFLHRNKIIKDIEI